MFPGQALGGATFLGLARALTSATTFDEALALAAEGEAANVDTLVEDIYGSTGCVDLGLPPSLTAASFGTGQDKRAKFPTSKAPISAVFHSFRLIFGRAIISRSGLEAWMFFLERARAEHSR